LCPSFYRAIGIDPTYPGGNFYSSDGINPSALGHAVIANEIIGRINEFYKLEIELISIKNFGKN
jgi:lysophospholipase L1-like esterase